MESNSTMTWKLSFIPLIVYTYICIYICTRTHTHTYICTYICVALVFPSSPVDIFCTTVRNEEFNSQFISSRDANFCYEFILFKMNCFIASNIRIIINSLSKKKSLLYLFKLLPLGDFLWCISHLYAKHFLYQFNAYGLTWLILACEERMAQYSSCFEIKRINL
jgi:hypothetical protein